MTDAQLISDGRTSSVNYQIRTGVIVDWTNKKVGVAFYNLAGFTSGPDASRIYNIYGLS